MNQEVSSQPIKLPKKPLHNPLTKEHEEALHWVLPRLDIAEDMLARAALCGLDVTERGGRHESHKAVAKTIKELFFPDTLPTENV